MSIAGLISENSFFQSLSPAFRQDLEPRLTLREFPADSTIFFRGDPGTSLFIVISGTAAALLTNAEGIDYQIATFGPGEMFGEMAILTGEPRSATIKTLSPLRVFELDDADYRHLADKYPELNSKLFQLLANRLGVSASRRCAMELETKELMSSLASAQPRPEFDAFPGISKAVGEINDAISKAAGDDGHVLILGERGTDKTLAAQLIHHRWAAEKPRPLFILDCATPPPVVRQSGGKDPGGDQLHRELAQEAALFGHAAGSAGHAQGTRRGLLELADRGCLILEHLEELAPRVQQQLLAFIREGTLYRTGDHIPRTAKVRILSTASGTFDQLDSPGEFAGELLDLLQTSRIHIRPLRERKKDIPILAMYFLEQFNGKLHKQIKGFTQGALNILTDHHWPLNTSELCQVIERSAAVCQGEMIEGNQVFLDVAPFSSRGRYNLIRLPVVERIVRHPLVPGILPLLTIPVFLTIIGLNIWGPRHNNPATLLAWGVGWPLLLLSVLGTARSWCGYCPMQAIAGWLNVFRQRFVAVPSWLKNHGFLIGASGFALILILEHAFGMFHDPLATGLLLLTIVSGAILTHSIFGERVWCRHICPLGRMVSHYKQLSMVELAGNSNVCGSQCHSHDCIKEKRCPMGLHPAAARGSSDCVFCLSCLKNCPHRSVRVDSRLPWAELLERERPDFQGALFTIVLLSLVVATRLPETGFAGQWSHGLTRGTPAGEFILSLLIGGGYTGLALLASGPFRTPGWQTRFSAIGHAYLPLAFAGFFNIYFQQFVINGQHILPWLLPLVGLDTIIDPLWVTPNLGTLRALLPLTTVTGWVLSLFLLQRIAGKQVLSPRFLRPHRWLLGTTFALFLFMFY